MQRTLLAWIDRQRIGTLSDRGGIWSFRYASAWLEAPRNFALCPGLPLQAEEQQDGSSRRPVQWYFDNLLPEEGQRVLLASESCWPARPRWMAPMRSACSATTGPSPPAR